MHKCSSCKQLMHECSFHALNFALVHNMHASRHVCSSSYTRQQNERLVHARVQFKLHTPTKRTSRACTRAISNGNTSQVCRAHAENVAGIFENVSSCAVAARVVKFKVSGTVVLGPAHCSHCLISTGLSFFLYVPSRGHLASGCTRKLGGALDISYRHDKTHAQN